MKSSEDLKRCVRRICELLECEYGQKKHRAFCVSPLINPASPWIRTFTEYAKDWDWEEIVERR